MKKRVLPFGALLLCLLAFGGFGCRKKENVKVFPPRTPEEQAAVISNAKGDEKTGVMSTADALEADRIIDEAARQRTLSNDDIDWLISFYHKEPLKQSAKWGPTRHHIESLLAFSYVCDELDAKQREQVAQLCLPLLNSKAPTPGGTSSEKQVACNVLRKLKYRQALPQIEPLVNDPDKYVREAAQKAVAALK